LEFLHRTFPLPRHAETGVRGSHGSSAFPLLAIPENTKPPVPIAGHRRLMPLSVLTGRLTNDPGS